MRYLVALMIGVIAFSAEADTDKEFKQIALAKTLVKARLKDPDAVKFQGIYANKLPNGNLVICGEVNSKNKYGGYAGYQRFFSTGASVKFKEDSPETFDQIYQMVCPK